MRIDRLHIENFKKFASQDFDFNRHFTLLVGDNGSGKTSVLDALAVAMGIWLVRPPDSEVRNSGRNILSNEVRLVASYEGDRIQFRQNPTTTITASGNMAGQDGIEWTRRNFGGRYTNDAQAQRALEIIESVYKRDRLGEKLICPVLAYYGAGRAWLPSNKRSGDKAKSNGPARRWAAFYDCFSERIRFAKLQHWFLGEEIAAVNRNRRIRPGYETVKRAILRCVPGASKVWYDADLEHIVLTIDGDSQPFYNLSAGQRMMLALVADLAIKAVTQNAFLLPPDELGQENELPRLLQETPGVVLIDELDVHLHPIWQRRVATDLKETFPNIQFICTSHSPQVIGEVKPEEVRLLRAEHADTPAQSFGMDSNWILNVLMGGNEMDPEIKKDIKAVQACAVKREFPRAREILKSLRERVGNSEEIQFAASTIDRIELLGK